MYKFTLFLLDSYRDYRIVFVRKKSELKPDQHNKWDQKLYLIVFR